MCAPYLENLVEMFQGDHVALSASDVRRRVTAAYNFHRRLV